MAEKGIVEDTNYSVNHIDKEIILGIPALSLLPHLGQSFLSSPYGKMGSRHCTDKDVPPSPTPATSWMSPSLLKGLELNTSL